MARGHGRETTFQQNLVERAQIEDAVRELLAQVLDDVAAEGRPVIGLALKVRYAPFFTKTFTKKIAATFDRDTVLAKTMELVDEDRARPADPAARRPGGDGDARRRTRGPFADAQRLVSRLRSDDAILERSRHLAAATPRGEFVEIPGRHHFNAPGSRSFREAAVAFLGAP